MLNKMSSIVKQKDKNNNVKQEGYRLVSNKRSRTTMLSKRSTNVEQEEQNNRLNKRSKKKIKQEEQNNMLNKRSRVVALSKRSVEQQQR
jgi:hypothetical protein